MTTAKPVHFWLVKFLPFILFVSVILPRAARSGQAKSGLDGAVTSAASQRTVLILEISTHATNMSPQ